MPSRAPDLFARLDAGHGGPLQTFKRRIKFALRHFWYGDRLQAHSQALAGLGLADLLQRDPHLLVKGTRPYLWTGLAAAQRFEAQRQHLGWLARRFGAKGLLDFYAQGSVDLMAWAVGESHLALTLLPTQGPVREGELQLHLRLDGASVMRATLTVLPAAVCAAPGDGEVLLVGSMQGGKQAKDQVKQLTHLLERTPPRAVLLNALQGLAQGWALQGLVGVSDRGHVYAGYRGLARRLGLSYDELWQELGAPTRLGKALWQLPLHWTPRPESEVESKKRSQLRRRNALRQQIITSCAAGAAGLLRAPA